MNWEEKALAEIRNNFADRSFTASEAAKVLTSYSRGTIYRLLNDLAREGSMTKEGSQSRTCSRIGSRLRNSPAGRDTSELLSRSAAEADSFPELPSHY